MISNPYKINLTIFIILLIGFMFVVISDLNKSLFLTVNSFAATTNPFIWANLTFLGDTLPAAVIMLLFIRKRPDLVWSGIIATIVATLLTNLLKSYTGVLRPPAVLDKEVINIIGPSLMNRSFPSGHTVTIFTLNGILMFYFRSVYVRTSLIMLALLVGVSRIAVGVHWPADVLAGGALGIICATTGVYTMNKLRLSGNWKMQILAGIVLISAGVYLLFFYDCEYSQAIYIQYIYTSIVLIAGIREYYYLLKNKKSV